MTTNIFDSKKQPYISWKGSGINSNAPGITSRNIRPLTNNDETNSTPQKFGLPRPIKHYRRGYYTTNERYVATSTGGNLIKQLLDTPGSVTFQSYDNTICETCKGLVVINNWEPINNLSEKPTPETQQPPPGFCCNQQKNSLKRVRSANTIVKQNYYTTHEKYLLNRCQLFSQTQFNYLNTGNADSKPGSPDSLNNTYTGNLILKNKLCNKVEVKYKPSNYKFSKQGAVSSSDRILRLNLETINKNKNDIRNNPQEKSKYFPNSSGNIINCSCIYKSFRKVFSLGSALLQLTFISPPPLPPAPPLLFTNLRTTNLTATNSTLVDLFNTFKATHPMVPIVNTPYISVTPEITLLDENLVGLKINYKLYTDNPEDILPCGLSFSDIQADILNFYNTYISKIHVLDFDDIPLEGVVGSQFKSLLPEIEFSSPKGPLILLGAKLNGCFKNCANFNSNINNWDTKNITDMSEMFFGASSFNQQVLFDLTNATDLTSMFQGATNFNNGDIGNNGNNPIIINTTNKVKSFANIFNSASNFNQFIQIDTTGAETMYNMFYNAVSFNNGSVTNDGLNPLIFHTSPNLTTLETVFQGCEAFNQNIIFTDMSNVENMAGMFLYATTFNNGSIANDGLNPNPLIFNTSPTLKYLALAFAFATNFNQQLIFTDTTNVENMAYMFLSAETFNNGSVTNDGLNPMIFSASSNLQNLQGLFALATSFNQTVLFNDTSNVLYMSFMFIFAENFNNGSITNDGLNPLVLNNNPSLVTSGMMFYGNTSFNQTITMDASNVTELSFMFAYATSFNNGSLTNDGLNPLAFNTSDKLVTIESMFNHAISFNQNVTFTDTTSVEKTISMFEYAVLYNNGSLSNDALNPLTLTTSPSLNIMSNMFSNAINFNQTLIITDTSSMLLLDNMFNSATLFNNGSLTNDGLNPLTFNTTNQLYSLRYMFNEASSFNQVLTIVTNNVNEISYAFYNAVLFNNGDIVGGITSPMNWYFDNISFLNYDNYDTNSGLTLENKPAQLQ
jgi:surface protein